jgi:hypothetical protein
MNTPRQALVVPGGWSSWISRQLAYKGDKVVTPTHRPPLPSRKYSCTHLLAAGSTPEPWCGRKDTIGNWTRELPPCTVPQPTAPPRDIILFWKPIAQALIARISGHILIGILRIGGLISPRLKQVYHSNAVLTTNDNYICTATLRHVISESKLNSSCVIAYICLNLHSCMAWYSTFVFAVKQDGVLQ